LTKLRREAIRELLKIKPFLSYEELGALFPDVSEMTLRRDIEYFENSGEAIKVRGGARSARFITSSTDEAMSARMNSNVLPKERIAQCAAQLLETDRSIFLDSGSTVQRPSFPRDASPSPRRIRRLRSSCAAAVRAP